MINSKFRKQTFHFKRPSGTSRGILTKKYSWFIELRSEGKIGIGECSIIEGLSPDFSDSKSYEIKLHQTIELIQKEELTIENAHQKLIDFPSILFGLETAFLDLKNGEKGLIFDNSFSRGITSIPINGLVWMGSKSFMQEQIEEKISEGFTTLKLKIGIDFDKEIELLADLRRVFNSTKITLRVDANGAFHPSEAMEKLKQLAQLEIHSIEQPIAVNQWQEMKELCENSPIPIALDEELIGISSLDKKKNLLEVLQPPFIILKPSLHGGIHGTKEWINLAEERAIKWWITSALESNIGLNAVCQLAAEYENPMPQGLGTGSLYVDNSESNLVVEKGMIFKKISN